MVKEMIVCENCEGWGRVEHMNALTVDGDQTWEYIDCPVCKGQGMVEAPEAEEGEADA